MASIVLHARYPLHGLAVPGHHGRAGITGLVIEERTDMAFATVIAKREKRFALINAVNTTFGVVLPDGARRVTRGAVTSRASGRSNGSPAPKVRKRQGLRRGVRSRVGLFAAVSDQSDSRLVLRLSGPRVRDVLAKGVPLDLHPKVVQTRRCRLHARRAHVGATRHARRRADLSAHRAAQHGGQFLVVARGVGGRVRL